MIYIENKIIPFQQITQIMFQKQYIFPPVVVAGLCCNSLGTELSYNLIPSMEYIIEEIDGINKYKGMRIIWPENILDNTNLFISMIAVCREEDNI